jgi:hypothetical protein
MTALYFWIFTSKWIKLLGHYLRYPVDVLLLPVSILFGYFHGAIKMYAVMTLNVVCDLSFIIFKFRIFCHLLIVFSYLWSNAYASKRSPSFPPYFPLLPMTITHHNALISVSSLLQPVYPLFPVRAICHFQML